MKTETLIRELASDASPVKPIASVTRRYIVWLFVSLFSVAFGALFIGVRDNLVSSLNDRYFLLQASSTLLIGALATGMAFSSSVPAGKSRRGELLTSVTLAFGFSILMMGGLYDHHEQLGVGYKCVRNVVLLSLFPIAMISAMMARSFPLNRKRTIHLAFLGGSAIGCFSTRFVCLQDGTMHFFVWHLLPVLGFGLIGYGIGYWWDSKASSQRRT